MSATLLSNPGTERIISRRTRRDPVPHFKADLTSQLDAINGCPSLQVPEEHLARRVKRIVERFDIGCIESRYSSLGRHGYHPRNVLAVWVYASLIGIHHATKVAALLKTDSALRFLSGGYAISRSKLNEFREQNGELFEQLVEQTVSMAREAGMLSLDELAVDSLRVRAHASIKAVRTVIRSRKRLEELLAVDMTKLDDDERRIHEQKLAKHRHALAVCAERNQPSFVTTNEFATLTKFPEGAAAPGHRITTTAAGVKARVIVSVLVTSASSDCDQLGPAIDSALKTLNRIGVSPDEKIQAAADAGYRSPADLQYAVKNSDRIDILLAAGDEKDPWSRFFSRDKFVIHGDHSATCPAGETMKGPLEHSDGRVMWKGIGCKECSLHPQCTPGNYRTLTHKSETDRNRALLLARLEAPGGRERYNKRMCTVEPVFAHIESVMAYRRASSRFRATVVAEVLLKVLAYNVSRLLGAGKLWRVQCVVTPEGCLIPA